MTFPSSPSVNDVHQEGTKWWKWTGSVWARLHTRLSDQYPSNLTADGVASATSVRTALTATASATPNAWGAWVEVDPSLAANTDRVSIGIMVPTSSSAVDTSTLLQIGTGGSGSEAAWATVNAGYLDRGVILIVPGRIASGTRVAFRIQSVVASKTVNAVFSFPVAKELSVGNPVSMQALTASSHGLAVTAPGSLNTKGAWTEMASSTSAAFTALGAFPSMNSQTTMASGGLLLDIGIGASGSETVLIGDIYLAASNIEFFNALVPLLFGVDIPAGTRISARYARSSASNALDLILVGA